MFQQELYLVNQDKHGMLHFNYYSKVQYQDHDLIDNDIKKAKNTLNFIIKFIGIYGAMSAFKGVCDCHNTILITEFLDLNIRTCYWVV